MYKKNKQTLSYIVYLIKAYLNIEINIYLESERE